MANYNNLKAGIDAVIKTNGRQEISGAALNTQLKNMIAELGAGYQYMGVTTPATNPGTPDANVFYLASEAGTYTNFGGIVINEGEVCALVWNGTWAKQVTGAATADKLNQLGQKVDEIEDKTESVSAEHIVGDEELITILDSTNTELVKITPEYSDFKNLRADGIPVKPIEEIITPTTEEAVIFENDNGDEIARFDKEKLISLNNTRKKIYILSTDTEFEILDKFILADSQGNTDVIFERGTYTLSSIYLYMRDTLGWTGNRFGLPIGHNNRYFFNGSTIISNNPAGFTDVRDVLVTRTINGDYELYDGIIINNAGQYCIHDEGGGYSIPYSHYYKNMVLKYNGTSGQPFGCGTGFDANLRFEECIFETSWTGAITFAIHGPIVNPNNDPVSVDLRFNGCYFNSLNVGINQEYFDGSRDNLFLLIENCKMQGAVSDNNFEILSFNNSIS